MIKIERTFKKLIPINFLPKGSIFSPFNEVGGLYIKLSFKDGYADAFDLVKNEIRCFSYDTQVVEYNAKLIIEEVK